VEAPADQPSLMMAYRAPVLRDIEQDWEPYALEMLAGVLDGHDAARLNSALVRSEKIANAVGAGYDSTQRGPGMFMIVPVIVPVKAGLGSPKKRLMLAAVTFRGAGLMVRVPLLSTTV